jgi:hypothetical protein
VIASLTKDFFSAERIVVARAVKIDNMAIGGFFEDWAICIYDKEMGRQWLEESFGDQPMILAAVLRPWPSELMEAHEVSTLVNSPENDSARMIRSFAEASAIASVLTIGIERANYLDVLKRLH